MSKSTKLVRTIRLDDAELQEIHKRLDEIDSEIASERRKSPRHKYNVKGCVIHLQSQGGGPPTSYLVPTRNISNIGMSFLHGSLLYPGAKCVIQLITIHGTWKNVPAEIVRCVYVDNGVHDVGVRFMADIDSSEYCAEAAPCRVLIVDDSPAIIKLTEVHLKELNAVIDSTNDGESAIEFASQHLYDVILMDMIMPGVDGYEAVRRLRATGYSGAIVAFTAMSRPGDKEKCLEAGCDNHLPKPFTREQLSALIRSYRQEPLISSITNDRSLLPLIDAFIADLPARIRNLESALANRDSEAVMSALNALNEEAGSFGFEPIAESATHVKDAILKNVPEEETKKLVSHLLRLCRQVRQSTRT